jgi:hypothetical protein
MRISWIVHKRQESLAVPQCYLDLPWRKSPTRQRQKLLSTRKFSGGFFPEPFRLHKKAPQRPP